MTGLAPVITLLVIVAVSLLVTRIATVALSFTGLSRELARFQARSAFSGTGFTTSESERVVEHPVRRRIILILMLVGNGVFIGTVSTLVATFLQTSGTGSMLSTVALLVVGLGLLWLISASKWIDKWMSVVIGWALRRWTHLDARDYHGLLHLSEGYTVTEYVVHQGDWVQGKPLIELRLGDEGLQVLGILRKTGEYVGTPTGSTYIRQGDTLILYGRTDLLAEIEGRKAGPAGDEGHRRRIEEQQRLLALQKGEERMRGERDSGKGATGETSA